MELDPVSPPALPGRSQQVSFCLTSSDEQWRAAARVRYQAYLPIGYTRDNEEGLVRDHFDALPEALTFVALDGDRVLGTLQLVIDSPAHGLPLDGKGFGDVLDRLRAPGRLLGEMRFFAFHPESRDLPWSARIGLQRLMYRTALSRGVTDVINVVIERHVGHYQRVMGFERICEPRLHPTVQRMAVMLRLECSQAGGERLERVVASGRREAGDGSE